MPASNQTSGQTNWQEKREGLYNQLIVGAAAIKKLQEIAKDHREPAKIEEATSKLETYLTDNQSEVLYETSERLKDRIQTAKEFYEKNIEHEVEKGELENTRDFLIDLDVANVHVKDVEPNPYGLQMTFGPIMWGRLNHFLTGKDERVVGGKALSFFWDPEENKYSKNRFEVTSELSYEGVEDDEDFEKELASIDRVKELGLYFVQEESELSRLFLELYAEETGGESVSFFPGSKNPEGTRDHEESHLFQFLYPFEPESGITAKLSDLKKSLKNEAVAYLVDGHEYNIFLANGYNKGETLEEQMERMVKEDKEEQECRLQRKKDRKRRVEQGELPAIGPFRTSEEEIKELGSQIEDIEEYYEELNQVRVANKEAVHEAINHIPKDILAEVIRNMGFDKIYRRLPKLTEVYERRKEDSEYTPEVEEIMELELSN